MGDEILAVNATRISGTSIALEDVMKILECEYPLVRLEILPSYAATCYSKCGTWKARGTFFYILHIVIMFTNQCSCLISQKSF